MVRSITVNIQGRILSGTLRLLALATVGTGVLMGCNIVKPLSYVLEGPGQVEPEYELQDVVTMVFVDDRKSAFPRSALRAIVARTIAEKVVEELVLPAGKMIDPRDTLALARSLESSNNPVSIERIGREAGAEQVIYVELDGFALTLDGFTPRPTSVCRVKVLDLAVGQRVYPNTATRGQEVMSQLREVNPSNFESFSRRRTIENELAVETGTEVAKLFHKHERVDLGENLGAGR